LTVRVEVIEKSAPGYADLYYDVRFNTNGGSEIADQRILSGRTAERPEDPIKQGYIFAGWYIDKELTKEFDFDTAITARTILYAKWIHLEPDHTHDYSSEWNTNESEHWKECDCGDKNELASHKDSDNDGKCDACQFNLNDGSVSQDTSPNDNIVVVIVAVVIIVILGGATLAWFVIKKKKQK